MRCISPHASYSIQVIEAEEQIVMDARGFAQTVTLKKPVIANFHQGGLLDHEIDAALSIFNFSGLPEGVNPLTTISAFDTEAQGYSDEMFVQVEQRLRLLQPDNPTQFIIVDQPAAARPWPSYDDDTAEDVLKFQERLRMSPELIRLYELENANRPEIILAMLKKSDPEAAVRYEAGLTPVAVAEPVAPVAPDEPQDEGLDSGEDVTVGA